MAALLEVRNVSKRFGGVQANSDITFDVHRGEKPEREPGMPRGVDEAQARGANAVVAFRFETNEFAQTGIEVCAYGTAVYIAPDGQQGGQQAHQGQQGGAQQWNAPASQSMGQQFAGGSGEPSQQWQGNADAQR